MNGIFPAWLGTTAVGEVKIVKEYIEVGGGGSYGPISRIFVKAKLLINNNDKEKPKVKVKLL